ncbi:WD repeat-containing protein 70 [Cocos nucifera]|uniref:WD repeat-containing protein 70 n=1 Tax=Cocos nucifera TaxID=13894 RepID=A0A8K0N542_COCNU|nr:WD repeat-containing protein 70 [Cocos nucifera]
MEAGDMDEAIRAQFPLSFGKPSKVQTQTSAVHSSTRRTSAASASPKQSSRPEPGSRGSGDASGGLNGRGEDDDDGVMIGPPPPPPQADQAEPPDADEGVMIGPPRPPLASKQVDWDDDGSDSGMDDSLEDLPRIPLSNEIVLRGHSKVVSALAVDHSGSRVLSGSYDYTVRMYDFQGMNSKLQSFRQLEPFEGHQVRSLSWSPTSDRFLCITGSAQAKVIKPKLARPARIPLTACAWDRDGKRIVGGVGDGSIQIWSIKPGWGSRPDIRVEKAHADDITGLKFSTDGQILLSRSTDSTLKVWNLRQMKSPVRVFEDLPNHYSQTNAAFSPDEQLIFTGTSVERDGTSGGLLCFFDRRKLELVSRVGISPKCSVVCCAWHPRINQVFATVGDKKEGGTHILYDPSISQRGALICVGRAPRKKSVDDFEVQPVIHNPHALPLFRDQPSRKRQREKALKDPLKSHKPELPVTGPGFGGRVGASKGSLLTQYLLKQGGLIKETWMEEDPREAILKYADVAVKDPKYIAPAYAETQPEPVFTKSDSEEEEK